MKSTCLIHKFVDETIFSNIQNVLIQLHVLTTQYNVKLNAACLLFSVTARQQRAVVQRPHGQISLYFYIYQIAKQH